MEKIDVRGNTAEERERQELSLSLPNRSAKESFIKAVEEFQKENEWRGKDVDFFEHHFDEYLKRLNGKSEEKNIEDREKDVPTTEYWLMDGDKFIGDIRVRHRLNDRLRRIGGNIGYKIRPSERHKGYATKMLGMALEKAKEFGLKEVLITCDEDNIPSRKTIESNGGKLLESDVRIEEWPVPIRRYKIDLEAKE